MVDGSGTRQGACGAVANKRSARVEAVEMTRARLACVKDEQRRRLGARLRIILTCRGLRKVST